MTRSRTGRLTLALLLACGIIAAATNPAAADLITYNLDQSNALPSGTVYGSVTVESFKNLGEVKLTYSADPTPYTSVGKNFGFHTIGFNTDLTLNPSQFTLPTGWSASANANLSTFGVFSWKVTTNNHEAPVVSVLIDGLGNNATLDHFTLLSTGGKSVFFAGHIIDFSRKGSDVSSHWVGGSSDPLPPPPGGEGGPGGPFAPSPEPSTIAMGMIAMAGLTLRRLTRRR
jgi:hypothetical protein